MTHKEHGAGHRLFNKAHGLRHLLHETSSSHLIIAWQAIAQRAIAQSLQPNGFISINSYIDQAEKTCRCAFIDLSSREYVQNQKRNNFQTCRYADTTTKAVFHASPRPVCVIFVMMVADAAGGHSLAAEELLKLPRACNAIRPLSKLFLCGYRYFYFVYQYYANIIRRKMVFLDKK